jgi:hypothetical protein
VPIVGDIMASRWAFEALAVEQFQDNRFEKLFFDQELIMSESYFRTAFLIPRLQYKLEECNRLEDEGKKNDPKFISDLNIIFNEIQILQKSAQLPPFDNLQKLNSAGFNNQISEETNGYLRFIKAQFSELSSLAGQKKDLTYRKLVDSLSADGVFRLKQKNYNKALSDWVLNTNEVTKYLETDNRIVQKHEPVFMLPNHPWGRAQFYAPMKYFNGQYVKTLWFNLAIMWLFSLLLFISLQVDLLRRVISYFETLRLNRFLQKEIRR